MNTTDSLSARGQRILNTPLRIDAELSSQARLNLYHEKDNPNGALLLNIAENRLNWPLLKSKFEQICREHPLDDWVATYAPENGAQPVREAIAGFLTRHFADADIDPDGLALSSGAAGVIEMSSLISADTGDVAVIPAPAYPVYKQDIGNIAGLERYDLQLPGIDDVTNTPALTLQDLERAKSDIQAQGKRMRLLILTSPDNPTGLIYSKTQYEQIANWCIQHQIHLFVNEIYALSRIDTHHPTIADDYDIHQPFYSFLNIISNYNSPYLHLWYAFSKDFGLSGFRVGLVYSKNKAFIKAYDNLNCGHTVSNHTQWLIMHLLNDHEFIRHYIGAHQQSLTHAYVKVIQCLKDNQIPYHPSFGSLFIWADFNRFLSTQSDTAELDFWQHLYQQTNILLTPGIGFGHSKRGLLRIVFTAVDAETLELVLKRLNTFIAQQKS